MWFFSSKHKPYEIKKDYMQILKPDSPEARENCYAFIHRLIANKMLGSRLHPMK